MPRPPKNQATIDDLRLEDPELAQALQLCTANEAAAKTYLDARHQIKTILLNEHEAAINAKTPDGRDRWCVVDGHRFLAKTAVRKAAKKAAGAGTNWSLDAVRIGEPS